MNKFLKSVDPLTKTRRHFLADNNMMMKLGHRQINLQFYFFISSVALYKTDVDNILPVDPEKKRALSFLFYNKCCDLLHI